MGRCVDEKKTEEEQLEMLLMMLSALGLSGLARPPYGDAAEAIAIADLYLSV